MPLDLPSDIAYEYDYINLLRAGGAAMILDKKQMTVEDIKLNYSTSAISRSGWGEWRQHHHGDEDCEWSDQYPWLY